MTPQLSVILPVYNRTALLAHPLGSLQAASAAAPGLVWELIVVDDGSTEDVAAALAAFPGLPVTLHRLSQNSGLLAARLAGLGLAHGDAVFFLDGDDAVAPGKFTVQLPGLAEADVVYGDMARRILDEAGRPAGPLRTDSPSPQSRDPAEFYLAVQPAPHNPIFRRSYLQAAIAAAFSPARDYDSIAETWYYYQLSIRPARLGYVPGAWSIVGEPVGERLSRKWERQAAHSLQLMRAFFRTCPVTPETAEARRRVGLCVFATWRAFPHGFPPAGKFIDLWRQAPPVPTTMLGGAAFAHVARWLGPATAGRIFKLAQRPSYRRVRTVDAGELAALFAS